MYVPKILILSLTKFTHIQFVDVFVLNLEAPIQHASDFCRFNFNEGIMFSSDFEKAFDSVDHCFIFACLKRFGFGTQFVQWVKTLFKNAQSCVMNNGFSTGYLALERGTRQGDPLSAYLFILAIEVLLIRVRDSELVRGIRVIDEEIKLDAYADDGRFFLKTFSLCILS